MSVCYIFSASKINNYEYIKLDLKMNDFIICADGGIIHALKLGIKPDLIVGDFDSYEENIPFDCKVIKLDTKKDDTDTISCVKKAIELGFKKIVIYGGLGNRLDHTIANIQTLKFGKKLGCDIELIDETTKVFLLENQTYSGVFEKGKVISVFCVGEKARGVSLKGLAYKLDKVTLEDSFPIGVSNAFKEENYKIVVEEGTLLIIISNI